MVLAPFSVSRTLNSAVIITDQRGKSRDLDDFLRKNLQGFLHVLAECSRVNVMGTRTCHGVIVVVGVHLVRAIDTIYGALIGTDAPSPLVGSEAVGNAVENAMQGHGEDLKGERGGRRVDDHAAFCAARKEYPAARNALRSLRASPFDREV